jgi:hypothetical protein
MCLRATVALANLKNTVALATRLAISRANSSRNGSTAALRRSYAWPQHGGATVNVLSILSLATMPMMGTYSPAKAAARCRRPVPGAERPFGPCHLSSSAAFRAKADTIHSFTFSVAFRNKVFRKCRLTLFISIDIINLWLQLQ